MVQNEPVLLVVAAERFELKGVERRLRQVRRLRWPVRFAVHGRLPDGSAVILVADGPGPRRAAAALEAVSANGTQARAVVSTGLCGGLDPKLAAGDIFVASEVEADSPPGRFPALKPKVERGYPGGLVYSADRVVVGVEEKSALHARGAAAVEMEAGTIARYASQNKVPFYCVRAVSDTATEGFALDLNAMRDAQGRFCRGRIVWAACLRPFSVLPELFRLWRRGELASERLGEFLASCRF
jgi:adenosylhomocysteine nucleosidase